jgi:concanavalin A-like lectin/glucanase superfamily protein/galactose oxidase-like protein/Big-like domain-containing protein/Kelch motif protein
MMFPRLVRAVDSTCKGIVTFLLAVGMAISVYPYPVSAHRGGVHLADAQAAIPSLVAAFGFNEGTGGTVSDSSGNPNTGVISGAIWTNPGKFGTALSFNGTTSNIAVANSPSLQSPSTAITVSAWIRPNGSSQAWSSIVQKVNASNDVSFSFGQNASNIRRLSGYLQVNGTVYKTAISKAMTNLTWYFVALTWQSGQWVTLTIYNANGSVFHTVTSTQAPSGSISYDASPLLIGEDEAGDNWKGMIDEVRIYSRALTPSEIQSDMNAPIPSPPVPQPDATPPTVSITAPTAGATVSGVITVSAFATDNVGVSGVQFLLNGAPFGSEDTTAPYAVVWDTTTAPTGPNTLTAQARDAAGNTARAADMTVYVSTSPPSQSDSLVAAYSFAEGSGPIVADSSGNNNTGNLTGAIWTTQGKFGKALSFNGGSSVTVNDSNSLDLTTGMTIEAWVYPTVASTNWSTAVMKEQSNGLAYVLYAGSPANQPNVYIYPSAEQGVAGTAPLPLNTWSHLAGTYDGITLRLYVNGAQVASKAVSGSIVSSTGALRIGGNSVWGEYFQGIIDEVRIYSRALSQTEIQNNMNTPIGGTPIPTPDPAQVGQWSGPSAWPIVAVHMTLLRTGEVLMVDGEGYGTDVRLWNPATNAFTSVASSDNTFCSGHCSLPDGRTLVAGGHDAVFDGITDANIFDPGTRTWSSTPPMAFARWYPTVTALPDGRALVVSGAINCATCIADIPEVYNPGTNTWAQLTQARLTLPLYPQMFVLPDGRVLAAGASEGMIASQVLDLSTSRWTTVDPVAYDGASAAMYRPGKVVKSGTSATSDPPYIPSSANTYVLDMTQPAPTWRQVTPMAFPRAYHNLTLLPDGSVIVTGGGEVTDQFNQSRAVYEAEIWSPVTETWTTMARMQVPRLYHSTGLLLPDGRVLVAGGGRFAGTAVDDQLSAEIYSPPYLFRGARPTITLNPTTISYTTNFSVGTPDAARIAQVSLVRLGSVTHAFNQDQRFLELTFQQTSGELNVQGPANANMAPPGYYMLFIVDTNGVPSVAAFVRLL